MSMSKPTHSSEHATMPTHCESRTDATPHEPLAVRALQRKAELEEALAKLPDTDLRARNDIELALSSIGALLTGDLEHVAHVTGEEISTWLESTKHLAELTLTPTHSEN